jgi:hypothetical protein
VRLGYRWLYVAIASSAVLGETVPHDQLRGRRDLVEVVNFFVRRKLGGIARYGLITHTEKGSGTVLFGEDPQGISPLFAAIG